MRTRPIAALTVALALLPLGSSGAGSATVSTPCDALPDTAVADDAVVGDRFLSDVDGDGARDVVTGYMSGNADPDLADHYLHVELASGWGTQFRVNSVADFSAAPTVSPARVVVMGGEPLIVVGVAFNLVGVSYAMFSFRDCALAPVPLVGGGYPEIWAGFGLLHREWFECQSDRVVMLNLSRGLDENGDLIEGVLVGGQVAIYRLEALAFRRVFDAVDLGLPRTDTDLMQEYPDCSAYLGTFVDDNGSVFEDSIDWLAVERITMGCNPPVNDRFCPRDPVTRGEMAAFLVRAMGYVDDGGGDLFVDDDANVFEGAIDRLGAAGVTEGCNPPTNDRFCPDDPVTRGQLAAFLKRALD